MSEGHRDERETSPRHLEFASIATSIYMVAGLLLVLPSLFLALGLQAIGAASGWWHGDPNSNDGEQVFGTFGGGVAALIILAGAAAIVRAIAKRYRIRSTVPISVGTLVLVVAVAGFCVWTVASAA